MTLSEVFEQDTYYIYTIEANNQSPPQVSYMSTPIPPDGRLFTSQVVYECCLYHLRHLVFKTIWQRKKKKEKRQDLNPEEGDR